MKKRIYIGFALFAALAARPSCAAETNESAVCDHADCHSHEVRSGFIWSLGELETNKIDLLVVFDRSAVEWLAKSQYATAENYAKASIEHLNGILARTELDKHFTFRLAGFSEIKYSFAGENPHRLASVAAGLDKATGVEMGAFKRIRAERNKFKADIVAVMTGSCPTNVYGGSVSLRDSDFTPARLAAFKERAYCFCSISHAMTRYTLMHEIGHIMGAGHFASGSSPHAGPQLFHYSSSHYFTVGENRYTTLMGSRFNGDDTNTYERIPMFSSPGHKFSTSVNGQEMGCAVGTPDHDNSRTLRETYPYVANFRVASKMDVIPVDPNAIRLSVMTGGVEFAKNKTLNLRRLLSHDLVIKAESAIKPRVSVIGLPMGMYYSPGTGRLMGWPIKAGKYTVKVSANNKLGYQASLKLKLRVRPFQKGEEGDAYPRFMDKMKWKRDWKRPEGTPYSLPKPLTVRLTAETEGDFGLSDNDWIELTMTNAEGAGRIVGELSGAKISSFQSFVRFGAGGGAGPSRERVSCLVCIPAQEGTPFVGYSRWINLFITVDDEWRISKLEVASATKP